MKKINKVEKECIKFIKNGKLSKWYYYLVLPFVPFIIYILTFIFIIYKLMQDLKKEIKKTMKKDKELRKNKKGVRK